MMHIGVVVWGWKGNGIIEENAVLRFWDYNVLTTA